MRDSECVETWHGCPATSLHDLEFSNYGISIRGLSEPEDSIGDREDRISLFLFAVFAKQKRGYFPAREVESEALNELVETERGSNRRVPDPSANRAKRIHHDDAGLRLLDFRNNLLKHAVEVATHHLFTEINEVDGGAGETGIEKTELLLISQHLDRWLAQDREIDGGSFRGCVGEYDLMRERCLARARTTRNKIEGEFGKSTAEHRVESWYSGDEILNKCRLVFHCALALLFSCSPSYEGPGRVRSIRFAAISAPMSRPRSSIVATIAA